MSSSSRVASSSIQAPSPRKELHRPKEHELFKFAPVSFVNNVINATNDHLCDGIDALEEALLEQPEAKGREERVTQGVNKVHTALQQKFDRNMDKFELYVLRNILKVPQGMEEPLAELEVKEKYSEADENQLDSQLADLHNKLLATKYIAYSRQKQLDNALQESTYYEQCALRLAQIMEGPEGNRINQLREIKHLLADATAVHSSIQRTEATLAQREAALSGGAKAMDVSGSGATSSTPASSFAIQHGDLHISSLENLVGLASDMNMPQSNP
eukprot:TRINITY_DN14830_c0_g1_i1.p1 TRINITY_DN14830_c0_g1~~TRINITY_DN14830_c0_g1_i1.p1  ORF type:complete len:272 (+),score=75.47 TRINITY_DN14830_c0_g1_i1:210-1025(+)